MAPGQIIGRIAAHDAVRAPGAVQVFTLAALAGRQVTAFDDIARQLDLVDGQGRLTPAAAESLILQMSTEEPRMFRSLADSFYTLNARALEERLSRLAPPLRREYVSAVRARRPVDPEFRHASELASHGLVVIGACGDTPAWMPLKPPRERLIGGLNLDILQRLIWHLDHETASALRRLDSAHRDAVGVQDLGALQMGEHVDRTVALLKRGELDRHGLSSLLGRSVTMIRGPQAMLRRRDSATGEPWTRAGDQRHRHFLIEEVLTVLTWATLWRVGSDADAYRDLACTHLQATCEALRVDESGQVDVPEWSVPLICKVMHSLLAHAPELGPSPHFRVAAGAAVELVHAAADTRAPWLQHLQRAGTAVEAQPEAQSAQVLAALRDLASDVHRGSPEHAEDRASAVEKLNALAWAFLPTSMHALGLQRLALWAQAVQTGQARWLQAGQPADALYRALDGERFRAIGHELLGSPEETFEGIKRFHEVCEAVPVPRGPFLGGLLDFLRAELEDDYSEEGLHAWLRAGDLVAQEARPDDRAAAFWQYLNAMLPGRVTDDDPERADDARRAIFERIVGLSNAVDPEVLGRYVQAHAIREGSGVETFWTTTDSASLADWIGHLRTRADADAAGAAGRAGCLALLEAMQPYV